MGTKQNSKLIYNRKDDVIKNNEILLRVKVKSKDINKTIFFLTDKISLEKSSDYILYLEDSHKNLLKNSIKEIKNNSVAYINGKKSLALNYFIPKKIGIYPIKIIFHKKMKYCCFMFACCYNIIEIDLSNFDTSDIVNMSGMFYGCKLLKHISGISCWNISNVIDMSYMFFYCESIQIFPDISLWNTSNVEKMNKMFAKCRSLLAAPDISKWNVSKVKNMQYMFFLCKSLSYFPDISNWNVTNLKDITGMFEQCHSLTYFPNLSNLNIPNNIRMDYLFFNCFSLSFISNKSILKRNISSYKANTNCISLLLPK